MEPGQGARPYQLAVQAIGLEARIDESLQAVRKVQGIGEVPQDRETVDIAELPKLSNSEVLVCIYIE